MTGRAVLLTGSLASGKTAVAQEIVAVAKQLDLRAAAIDVDWLGWATGATVGLDELIARNLSAVADNYVAAGSTTSSSLAPSSIRAACRPSPARCRNGSSR